MNENLKSMYYLFPDQDPYQVPISERNKVLIAKPEGWEYLTRHLTRTEKEEKAIAEEKARKQYLKEGSYNMTKNWDNSIEKVRQRRLEEHKLRIQTKIEDRMAKFMELTKAQEAERQKYIQDVKKRMFTSQEKQRNLNSALMLSETLYERNLQDEFNARIRAAQEIDEAEYAQKVFKDAEEELSGNSEKAIARRQKNEKYKNDLIAQIKTKEDKHKEEFEKERQAEILDNQLALQELEDIIKFEKEKDRSQKMATRKMIEDFKKTQERIRDEENEEDRLIDQINDIYNNAKCIINEKKKAKLEELQEERLKLRDNAARLVMVSMEGAGNAEKKSLENAIKEKEELQLMREEAEKEYRKQLRNDRIEDRQQWLKDEFEKKQKQHERDKLALLARMKNDECVKSHNKQNRENDHLKRKQYAQDLKEQMLENEMKIKAEKDEEAADLQYQKDKLAKIDKKFFEYADEVYDLAKSRGRITYPIEQITEQYKYDTGAKRKVNKGTLVEQAVGKDDKKNVLFSRRRYFCDVNVSSIALE